MLFYLAIGLTIIANIAYHLFLKITPQNSNPVVALATTYLTAMTACILLFPFFSQEGGLMESLRKVNWTSIALGLSIVGLEMGFLIAYRAGGNISVAPVISNTAVALLIIPIGVLFFSEALTAKKVLGIALCLVGLYFINQADTPV
ncbi:EamA family transporter [Heliobacterium gestii]|uniref:EamA family transporter n=1 Tax=Heliomicrobium gestii TaxID=2699 RepID=A0A845LBX8_HELGE|nr:EamA family transporter [Heliomicrobium gestii]MBM7865769.1 putative membrane protein [Heliomicrobium gestii]MZP42015.1 EamA family transporter [Heliomicrobium gestii]